MRNYLIQALCILVITLSAGLLVMKAVKALKHRQEAWQRDQVVMLHSDVGSCSGIATTMPSGKVMILTAGHCRPLLDAKNQLLVQDEEGRESIGQLVAEDPTSDLMLIADDYLPSGVDIGPELSQHQAVHTITHGGGAKSYRTDGEVVDQIEVDVPESIIESVDELAKCLSVPKHGTATDFFGQAYCTIHEITMRSTARVIPGSSGGPIFDSAGRLVGVVSATDGNFGLFVRISDIKRFIRGF